MSDTDSFIDEVSDEIRRDKFYGMLRRYGWIAVLAVVLIVGGASFNEYRKAAARSQAEDFGDAILSALDADDSAARVASLSAVETDDPGARAVLQMLISAEEANAGNDAAAVSALDEVSTNGDVPDIYRQIASFKALVRSETDVATRRIGFEALAVAGNPLRLLAEEQLALLEVESGASDAALERLQRILADAEVTQGLRRRASQLIVALGGALEAG